MVFWAEGTPQLSGPPVAVRQSAWTATASAFLTAPSRVPVAMSGITPKAGLRLLPSDPKKAAAAAKKPIGETVSEWAWFLVKYAPVPVVIALGLAYSKPTPTLASLLPFGNHMSGGSGR